jgi:hypothetical protein
MPKKTNRKPEHTPTPWVVEPCVADCGESIVITAKDYGVLAKISPVTPEEADKRALKVWEGLHEPWDMPNAELIVRAVNTHDRLISALRFVVNNEYARQEESRNLENETLESYGELLKEAGE